jgi:hypothetical protein
MALDEVDREHLDYLIDSMSWEQFERFAKDMAELLEQGKAGWQEGHDGSLKGNG